MLKVLFLPLLALAMLWGGGQTVYTALKNNAPSELTCDQVMTQPPGAHWLSLSGCEYDLENLTVGGILSTVSELYIPLRPVGDTSRRMSQVVLFTKDKQLLEIVRAMDKAPNEDVALTHLERLVDLGTPERIEGLVRFGIDLDDDDVKKVRQANPTLPNDFVLLDQGKKPMAAWFGFSMLGGGLAVSALVASRLLRRPRGQ
jgi:hypothetical protein